MTTPELGPSMKQGGDDALPDYVQKEVLARVLNGVVTTLFKDTITPLRRRIAALEASLNKRSGAPGVNAPGVNIIADGGVTMAMPTAEIVAAIERLEAIARAPVRPIYDADGAVVGAVRDARA